MALYGRGRLLIELPHPRIVAYLSYLIIHLGELIDATFCPVQKPCINIEIAYDKLPFRTAPRQSRPP